MDLVFKRLLLANNHSHWSFCSQARNLAVYVEFRSSDDEVAKPLKVIRLIFLLYMHPCKLTVTLRPWFSAAVIV